MDFGPRPALGAADAPVPNPARLLAWFERSSTERGSAAEGGPAESGGGILERFREADGLVYNGEGDYEL